MDSPLRILMVEDSEDDALLLLRELRRGGYKPTFERVDTPEAMKAALLRDTWDVVIADYVMPRFSGLDALSLLHHSGLDLPFIIVSGKIGENIAVEAMRAGAHDYFLKGNLALLIPAIERELREAKVRNERKLGEEELRRAHDELERRVVERTAELVTANEELKAEMMERKRIEETLRESQDLLQAIIHGTNDAIFVKDRDCRVIMANPATLRIVGKTAEEVLGKKDTEIYADPEIGRSTMENDCRIMESGYSEIVEEIIKGPQGQQIFLSTKSPRLDADGRIVGIIGVACNITERKRAENELRKAHDELEIRVQERTAQLKDSLIEKEILLREIHHRVKNNMQVISGLLMLQEEFSNDEKFIEMIKESQNRIASMALIHEKLYRSENLSKIVFREYIDDLVSGLFESYGFTESKIGLKVNAENISMGIDAAIPVGLIINELVSNSLKHAFPEGKNGEINISMSSTGRDMIELSVQDNGIGIPDDLDFRKTQSLGLHIVNLLVENQLHGEIKLNKERGTEFRIRFGEINVKRK
ncbi:MAG TPA: histidine kinase dimerization/phosphoacceptor domain -containing protein [Candidatus Methanoperedens sp.]|nr:histidine kinase dimerization/phosphoacceptor domain -containing protein [Candidatus Methanoperedens sp.]